MSKLVLVCTMLSILFTAGCDGSIEVIRDGYPVIIQVAENDTTPEQPERDPSPELLFNTFEVIERETASAIGVFYELRHVVTGVHYYCMMDMTYNQDFATLTPAYDETGQIKVTK